MQPAQDGIFKQCRGIAALLVALCGTFAAASRHDTAPGAAGSCEDHGERDDNLQSWVWRTRLDAIAADAHRENPGTTVARDDNVNETIDVGVNAKALFIPVMIDGQKWWFLVDTGCGETYLDREVAIHLGIMNRQDPSLKERWKGTCRTLNATVGKSQIPLRCRAICFDLSHLRRCMNEFPLCGILGMNFLRGHVLGIDLDAGKLSFLKSVPENSGNQFNLWRDSHDRPLLSVGLPKNHLFVVDTGCGGPYAGTFKKDIFAHLVDQSHLTSVRGPVAIMTLDGVTMCDKATLDVFQVGRFEHNGLEFHDDDSTNLLGLAYLARYVVTLDFLNDYLYLKEGKRFDEPAAPTTSIASAQKQNQTDQPTINKHSLPLGLR